MTGQVVTMEKIEEAKALYAAHFKRDNMFNEEGWKYIAEVQWLLLFYKLSVVV